MQVRRMSGKLLVLWLSVYVLIAGCSKQPLNSMTIGQVSQLVDEWQHWKLPELQAELQESQATGRFPSVETFYKVFGKPKDKSLIGDSYYFRYQCKDGIVIIDINAWAFDHDYGVQILGVSVL